MGTAVGTVSEAWAAAGGDAQGHVNFTHVAKWAEMVGIGWPVGVDMAGGARPCRFNSGHVLCRCTDFVAVAGHSFCKCGHKPSCHRSEFASRALTHALASQVLPWPGDRVGLVQVEDTELLARLQKLLNRTHKATDNWTRDRGCKLHGVDGCPNAKCAFQHKAPVPTGYTLVKVYRNQNQDLWTKYSLAKIAIHEECARECSVAWAPLKVESNLDLGDPLAENCNELRVFHGTDAAACVDICQANFRVAMAGSGATWKDAGKSTGTPLYGFGLYFAERITKADEYARPIPPGTEDEGFHMVIVCRVVAGRVNVVTTNEIDTDKLRKDVLEGPYHSVLGDRIASLGKPYRELVVYDKDQVFPEFLLVCARQFASG